MEGPNILWQSSVYVSVYSQIQGRNKPSGTLCPANKAAQVSESQLEAADVKSASNVGSSVESKISSTPPQVRFESFRGLVLTQPGC